MRGRQPGFHHRRLDHGEALEAAIGRGHGNGQRAYRARALGGRSAQHVGERFLVELVGRRPNAFPRRPGLRGGPAAVAVAGKTRSPSATATADLCMTSTLPRSPRTRQAAAGYNQGMLFGKEHTRKYKETDGEVGHDWQGTQTLLLTTTGRQSGEPPASPLVPRDRADDVCPDRAASKGGGRHAAPGVVRGHAEPTLDRRGAGHGRPLQGAGAATPRPEEKAEMLADDDAGRIEGGYDEILAATKRPDLAAPQSSRVRERGLTRGRARRRRGSAPSRARASSPSFSKRSAYGRGRPARARTGAKPIRARVAGSSQNSSASSNARAAGSACTRPCAPRAEVQRAGFDH